MRASTLEKRTKILQVATGLFIEQGYKDTTLDQIVAICGGSKQTLYRYFSNKEGLFAEVLAHNTKENIDSIFRLTEKQDQPIQETLENFAVNYLKALCSESMLGIFRIIAADFNKNDVIYQEFWNNGPVRTHKYLAEFFETSEAGKALNIDDTYFACEQLLALVKLNYHNMALLGFDLPNDNELHLHCKKAIDAFLSIYQ